MIPVSANFASVFTEVEAVEAIEDVVTYGILLGFCVGIPCVTYACWKMFMDGWRDEDEE